MKCVLVLGAGPDERLAPGPGPSVNIGPWSPVPVVPAHLVPVITKAATDPSVSQSVFIITEKALRHYANQPACPL